MVMLKKAEAHDCLRTSYPILSTHEDFHRGDGQKVPRKNLPSNRNKPMLTNKKKFLCNKKFVFFGIEKKTRRIVLSLKPNRKMFFFSLKHDHSFQYCHRARKCTKDHCES